MWQGFQLVLLAVSFLLWTSFVDDREKEHARIWQATPSTSSDMTVL
jgi:hypothetical protein